jgi:hypothetical protein
MYPNTCPYCGQHDIATYPALPQKTTEPTTPGLKRAYEQATAAGEPATPYRVAMRSAHTHHTTHHLDLLALRHSLGIASGPLTTWQPLYNHELATILATLDAWLHGTTPK